jgi:hypothetical protein
MRTDVTLRAECNQMILGTIVRTLFTQICNDPCFMVNDKGTNNNNSRSIANA